MRRRWEDERGEHARFTHPVAFWDNILISSLSKEFLVKNNNDAVTIVTKDPNYWMGWNSSYESAISFVDKSSESVSRLFYYFSILFFEMAFFFFFESEFSGFRFQISLVLKIKIRKKRCVKLLDTRQSSDVEWIWIFNL